MPESTNDTLMRVVSKGQPMQAESSTDFIVGLAVDKLRQGFEPGQFCELQAFDFSVGFGSSLAEGDVKEDEEEPGAGAGAQSIPGATGGGQPGATRPALRPAAPLAAKSPAKAPAKAASPRQEFSDIQPVGFTRVMDTMSTLLFQAMTGCETLDSVSVVKRKAAGISNSGGCYLRLDFDKVLVTSLAWQSSGELVIESGTFIYRAVTIRYRPQLPDGSLGATVSQKWAMQAAA